MTVRLFLNLSLGILSALFLATTGLMYFGAEARRADEERLNLARRQQVLIQHMSEDVAALARAETIGDKYQLRQDLTQTLWLFEHSLVALEKGGPTQDDAGETIWIDGVSEPEVIASLKQTYELWALVGMPLLDLAAGAFTPDSPSGQETIAQLTETRAKLLALTTATSETLQQNLHTGVPLSDILQWICFALFLLAAGGIFFFIQGESILNFAARLKAAKAVLLAAPVISAAPAPPVAPPTTPPPVNMTGEGATDDVVPAAIGVAGTEPVVAVGSIPAGSTAAAPEKSAADINIWGAGPDEIPAPQASTPAPQAKAAPATEGKSSGKVFMLNKPDSAPPGPAASAPAAGSKPAAESKPSGGPVFIWNQPKSADGATSGNQPAAADKPGAAEPETKPRKVFMLNQPAAPPDPVPSAASETAPPESETPATDQAAAPAPVATAEDKPKKVFMLNKLDGVKAETAPNPAAASSPPAAEPTGDEATSADSTAGETAPPKKVFMLNKPD
ncbi:MAG: hypothetical protein ABIF77_09535, partial [bacterium]